MQCFKVFWAALSVPRSAYDDHVIDHVDRDINKLIAEMLKEGWRIVNVQSNISNTVGATQYSNHYQPYLAVSVLFENDK